MTERFVSSGSLRFWTESFGEATNPPLLLIFGSGGQGIFWPESFCERLGQAGFFVIRYDHRDTGRSSMCDYAAHPYSLEDLAQDALAILDGYGISRAHLVGASMGGCIGQLLAIHHPERVVTLTSMVSTPYKPLTPEDKETLPPATPEFLQFFAEEDKKPFPVTVQEYIEKELRIWRVCNGEGIDFEERSMRLLLERVSARLASLTDAEHGENHSRALACATDRRKALRKVKASTLVVHGDKDPLFPLEHGIATAREIPGATLVVIEKMGHIFPYTRSEYLADLILDYVKQVG